MTSSMTAFVHLQAQEEWGSLVWEIRSVNHRYLEPHFRLPEQAREVEPGLRGILRKQLNRGKVECSLRLQLAESGQKLNPNEAVLEEMRSAVNKVETWFINTSGVDPLEVLRWPGVMENEEVDFAPVHAAALKSFTEAVEKLKSMRQREGAELKQFILARLDSISEEIVAIRGILPILIQAQRQKILDRLEEARAELDPDRLEQEMIILAQKMDVDEELDRLNTHVQGSKTNSG